MTNVLDLSAYRDMPSELIPSEIRGLLDVFKASRTLQVPVMSERELRARMDALIAVAHERGDKLSGVFA